VLEGDRAVEFAEKPADGDAWISAGFFALEPAVLDEIDGDGTSLERVVLPKLARSGELMAYRHEGFWHPMDTLRDVRRLNQMDADESPPWKVWEKAT
jgi:glucose-1-phosphate cytidylyltransferase